MCPSCRVVWSPGRSEARRAESRGVHVHLGVAKPRRDGFGVVVFGTFATQRQLEIGHRQPSCVVSSECGEVSDERKDIR